MILNRLCLPLPGGRQFRRWAVLCGCPGHGDHLACTLRCAQFGCTWRVGKDAARWGWDR